MTRVVRSTVPRTAVRGLVADRIQEQILDGTLSAGDRLPPERELAEQLSVNRSSVREALKTLEQLGLVSSRQGSGTIVCSVEHASLDVLARLLFLDGKPNVPWIRDFLDLREAIAPGLVRAALERASDGELAEIIELLTRVLDPELEAGEYLDLLLSIQDGLVRATHNRVALQLWSSMRRVLTQLSFEPLRLGSARTRGVLVPALKRLAVAVHARDTSTAERSVRDLYRRAGALILAPIEEPARPGPAASVLARA